MISKSLNTSEKRLSVSYYLFYLAIIFSYVDFLRLGYDPTGSFISAPLRMLSYMMAPVLLVFTVIAALIEGQYRRLKRHYWIWILSIHFVIFILFINGLAIHFNDYRPIVFDLIYFVYFIPGILIGCKEKNWKGLDQLILYIYVLNSFLLIPSLTSFEGVVELSRNSIILADGQTPYLIWGGLASWTYFLLTLDSRTTIQKSLIYISSILYFVFALIFLKRGPFLELFLFFSFLLFANRLRIKFNFDFKTFLFLGIIIGSTYPLYKFLEFSTFAERLNDRVYEEGSLTSSILGNSRIAYDIDLVTSQISSQEWLIGRGIGGTVQDIGYNYPDFNTHTLHNFFALVLLKGGLIFFFTWYFGWIIFIKDFLQNKRESINKFFVPVLIPLVLSWLFGFVNVSVHFLLMMMCAGRIMSKENSIFDRKFND